SDMRQSEDTIGTLVFLLGIGLVYLPTVPFLVLDWFIRKSPLGWFYGLHQRSKLRLGQIVWLESRRQEQERMGCSVQGLVVDLSRIGQHQVGVRKRGVTGDGNIYLDWTETISVREIPTRFVLWFFYPQGDFGPWGPEPGEFTIVEVFD